MPRTPRRAPVTRIELKRVIDGPRPVVLDLGCGKHNVVYSDHFLEHVDRVVFVVGEIARVLKKSGPARVSTALFQP
jgi:hypothetical protein